MGDEDHKPIHKPVHERRHPRAGWLALVVLLAWGCSEANHQPTLDPIAPQTVLVGGVLTLELGVRDPDGDELIVSVSPLPKTATINTEPDGTVLFTWAPLASDTDQGGRVHTLLFTVDDGRGGLASRAVDITVVPPSGAPVFVGPQGYVLNLSEDNDISFLIEVKDDDSAEVELEITSDPIEGARFIPLGAKSASFYWEPTEEQRVAGNYWHLEVEARDESHAPVRRRFSILLMNTDAAKSCPGTPPVVATCEAASCVPLADLSDAGAVVFRADALDRESDVRQMTLHYATNNPGDPAAYEGNTIAMQRCDPSQDVGCPEDPLERYFIGVMANPAAAATEPLFLYYFLTAVDNDDFKGQGCDHTSRLPKSGHFTLATYPKGWTGSCKDDVSEPNESPDSAPLLEAGVTADLRHCVGGDDWFRLDVLPDTTISVDLLHEPRHGALAVTLHDVAGAQVFPPVGSPPTETVTWKPDGASLYVRVAVPDGAKGADQTYGLAVNTQLGVCPNDKLEPNDSVSEARFVGGESSSHEVVICPGDRDWYTVTAQAGESLLIDLSFQHAWGDLDLFLYDADGVAVLGRSETTSSNEGLTLHSLDGGTYNIEVRGYQGAHNTGQLDIQIVPTGTLCFEDGLSPNHGPLDALLLPENTYYDLLVCPDKEDWFRLDVNAGETLQVLAIPVYPEGAQLDLEMYSDPGGETVVGQPFSAEEPGAVSWLATAEKAGSLRWRVRTPGAFTAIYHLAFGVGDADLPGDCTDDRFSPTNTPLDALEVDNASGFVTRLKVCPGGEDWFKIKGAAYEELFVYVFGFPDEEPLSAELFHETGPNELFKLGVGESTTDGVEIRYLPEDNDYYYIHVKGVPGAIHHYDLVIGSQ